MADVTTIELYPPVTVRGILNTVRSLAAVKESSSQPERKRDPLLVAMARVAARRLPKAPKSGEFSERELQSTLCKEMVKWCLRQVEQTDPQEMILAIRQRVLNYTLLVSIPYACSQIPQKDQKSIDWLLYKEWGAASETIRPNKIPPEIREIEEGRKRDPKIKEDIDRLIRIILAHRDAWIQGVLGEVLVLRLAQKAGLQPECASVKEDIGPNHIDCFITYKGRRIPVQVKTSQYPENPRIIPDPKNGNRLIITIGCPSILDPKNNQYYEDGLYPSKEEAQKFKDLLGGILNFQNSTQGRKYGKC